MLEKIIKILLYNNNNDNNYYYGLLLKNYYYMIDMKFINFIIKNKIIITFEINTYRHITKLSSEYLECKNDHGFVYYRGLFSNKIFIIKCYMEFQDLIRDKKILENLKHFIKHKKITYVYINFLTFCEYYNIINYVDYNRNYIKYRLKLIKKFIHVLRKYCPIIILNHIVKMTEKYKFVINYNNYNNNYNNIIIINHVYKTTEHCNSIFLDDFFIITKHRKKEYKINYTESCNLLLYYFIINIIIN